MFGRMGDRETDDRRDMDFSTPKKVMKLQIAMVVSSFCGIVENDIYGLFFAPNFNCFPQHHKEDPQEIILRVFSVLAGLFDYRGYKFRLM
jgi:hypothetical protein